MLFVFGTAQSVKGNPCQFVLQGALTLRWTRMRSLNFMPDVHWRRVAKLAYSGVVSRPQLGVAPRQAILALADMVTCLC